MKTCFIAWSGLRASAWLPIRSSIHPQSPAEASWFDREAGEGVKGEEDVVFVVSLRVSSSSLVYFVCLQRDGQKHCCCLFSLCFQQTDGSLQPPLLSLCLEFRRLIIPQHQPSSNYHHTLTHTCAHTHTRSIIISLYVTALNNKNYTP